MNKFKKDIFSSPNYFLLLKYIFKLIALHHSVAACWGNSAMFCWFVLFVDSIFFNLVVACLDNYSLWFWMLCNRKYSFNIVFFLSLDSCYNGNILQLMLRIGITLELWPQIPKELK